MLLKINPDVWKVWLCWSGTQQESKLLDQRHLNWSMKDLKSTSIDPMAEYHGLVRLIQKEEKMTI